MKKTFSILLSIVMLFSIIAITVSAADAYDPANYDYAYKLVDYMSGSANAGSGTATLTSDEIDFTVEGGMLTKYSDYSNSGYKGFAQWNNSNNNRKLTIALKNIASGTYKLTIFSADNSSSRGIFDVAASGTSLGTVSFIANSATFVKHELDATFTTDGTSPVEITFVPTADATSKQAFLYSFGLTKVDGGESQEPESSTVTETTTTTTTTTTQAPVATESYSYVIYDNMEKDINPDGTETLATETDNMIIRVVGGLLHKYTNFISGYNCAQWNNSNENIALGFELKNIPAGEYALTLITADNNQSRGTFDIAANGVALGEMNCLNTTGLKITEHAFDTTFKADGRKNVNVSITPTATTTSRQIFLYSIVLTKVADYVPTPEVEITMVQGASVRFNEVTGMRYKATVNTEDVAYYEGKGYTVTMGTLIAPADKFASYEELTFQADANNFLDVVTTGYFNEETGTIAGSISNIKEANYGRNFIARAYVKLTKDGETYVSYATANDNTRSIKALANAVLDDDTMIPENEAQIELLNKWAAASDWA